MTLSNYTFQFISPKLTVVALLLLLFVLSLSFAVVLIELSLLVVFSPLLYAIVYDEACESTLIDLFIVINVG